MKGSPRCLYPGDPYCAPLAAALAESTVQLVRSLYKHDNWMGFVNTCILNGLKQIRSCLMSDSEVKKVGDNDLSRGQSADRLKLNSRSSSKEEFPETQRVSYLWIFV